jgi:tetratricopeptide (TPR) repeat protein
MTQQRLQRDDADRGTIGGFLGYMLGSVAGAIVGGVMAWSWVDGSILLRLIVAFIAAFIAAPLAGIVGILIGCCIGGSMDVLEATLKGVNFRALLWRASTEFQEGNWDQAVLSLTEVIRQEPWLIEPYHRRAIAYLALHDLERAIADCSQVIKSDPTPITRDEPVPPFVADAYIHRGTAFAGLGQHDNAIDDFTSAIELMPDAPTAYQWRAKSYRAMGDAKRAAEDEHKAHDLAKVVS